MKKTECLLANKNGDGEDQRYLLQRCIYCDLLVSPVHIDKLVCPNGKIFIDFHGSVIAKHIPDRRFNFKKFILYLADNGWPWQTLYWRVLAFG